jgi:LacI family transcriptional regulator
MKPTIREVAQHAGVSRTTVSYVLNGRDSMMRIPEDTRQRILDAVRDLNYRPNALARALSQRCTNTIALVMQFPAIFSGWSGFTTELMHGATDAAVEAGYDILLHTRRAAFSPVVSLDQEVAGEVSLLTDGRVDGTLLLRDQDDPLAAALEHQGFPTVLMFTHNDDPQGWFVDCDNVEGASLATQHLLNLGHRRILHLAGSAHSAAGSDRQRGYEQTLRKAGIELNSAYLIDTTREENGLRQGLELFKASEEQRPTAVFAWSDESAVQFMNLLRSQGLRIPEEVAVVGYDSTEVCEHTDPPLTSIRQPIYEMAYQAFQLLVSRIQGGEVPSRQVWTRPRLEIRQSCGAASARDRRVRS